MKRKQKVPRRTRPQGSVKLDENKANLTSAETEEVYAKTRENSTITWNSFTNTAEPENTTCGSKEFHDNVASLKKCLNTEDKAVNINVNRKHQKRKIGPNETNKNSTHKEISNPSDDSNVKILDLKESLDNFTHSVDVLKQPTPFINLRKGPDDNMPVILNVFSLSDSYPKLKVASRSSDFPVTPPCSPPLAKLQKFADPETVASSGKVRMSFSSAQCVTKPASKSSTVKSDFHVYNPVGYVPQHTTRVFPALEKHFVDQRNYKSHDQTRRYHSINYDGNKIQLLQYQTKNNLLDYAIRTMPPMEGFKPRENQLGGLFNLQEKYSSSEKDEPPNQRAPDLVQDIQRNHLERNEKLSDTNHELKDFEEPALDNFLRIYRHHSGHNMQYLQVSDAFSKAHTLDETDARKNAVNDNHATFLSPREVKVLELKKRLQEQEAALNKLRSTH